jgi:hypothetical protein
MEKLILSFVMAAALFFCLDSQAQDVKSSKAEKKQQPEDSAQDPKLTPEQRADKLVKKFTEKLKLSDDQVIKVRKILIDRENSVDVDKEKCKGDVTCLRSAKRERNRVCESQLKNVLTAEQYQRLQEIRKKAREKAKEKGKSANPDADPIEEAVEIPQQ